MKKLLALPWILVVLFLILAGSQGGLGGGTYPGGFRAGFAQGEGRAGDRAELVLEYDGTLGDVSALLLTVSYDPQKFQWLELSQATPAEDIYSTTYDDNGRLKSVFVLRQGVSLREGKVLTAWFEVKEEEAQDARFFVDVEQVAFAQGELGEDWHGTLDYRIEKAPSSKARLEWLRPSAGILSPEFSPEILEYRVTVPYEIEEMRFDSQAAEEGSFQVNRKKLGGGGSDTRFAITVTAADRKTKEIYEIMVQREEKPQPLPTIEPTPKPVRTPKPTATPKPARTPKPTATPKPTRTPKPTATPKPTMTPKPTATPKPSKTPKPTATPKPSKTPKPTATPKPSKTPSPSPGTGAITSQASPQGPGVRLVIANDGLTGDQAALFVIGGTLILGGLMLFSAYHWDKKKPEGDKNAPSNPDPPTEAGEEEEEIEDDHWLLR